MKRASIATSRIFPIALTLLFSPAALAADPVSIHIAHNCRREMQILLALWQTLSNCQPHKYTFTHGAISEEPAMNHAFPMLRLEYLFGRSPDELLSTPSRALALVFARARKTHQGCACGHDSCGRPQLCRKCLEKLN